ncbi:MAG: hypothetical protein ACSHXW_18045 [Yoonia sp.]
MSWYFPVFDGGWCLSLALCRSDSLPVDFWVFAEGEPFKMAADHTACFCKVALGFSRDRQVKNTFVGIQIALAKRELDQTSLRIKLYFNLMREVLAQLLQIAAGPFGCEFCVASKHFCLLSVEDRNRQNAPL